MHLVSLSSIGKESRFSPNAINSALKWLADPAHQALAVGKYEIEGGCLAIVQEYEPNTFASSEFENHHKMIDIQFLVSGKEYLYWTNTREANNLKEYSSEKDIEFFKPIADEAAYTRIALDGDRFVILWPGDWHMPCVESPIVKSGEKKVKKIVIKIPVV